MRLDRILALSTLTFLMVLLAGPAMAAPSPCEDCHVKTTPGMVADFNRGKMAGTMTCASCHGENHKGTDDVSMAQLPTIGTCNSCHEDQAKQYMAGKHAIGLVALEALPISHGQPMPFIEGQKGCGGCHTMGLTDAAARATDSRKYYPYGMDCQNCHTRHAFSAAEAREPEACRTCHMGFDHPQWEMWSSSKHGVAYLLDRETGRGPKCQDCHMPDGDHRVLTPWGFLAVRLPEPDEEWMGFRATILKGLGVLDEAGQPTALLDVVKAGNLARLDQETFDAERNRITEVCRNCHGASFVAENIKNGDAMLKEADRLFAEMIEIVAGLRRDGLIEIREGESVYPPLLSLYEVPTKAEQILYEAFMSHRMKTFMGSFHMNPDYVTWYGYAELKQDLAEIREIDRELRERHAGVNP